MKSIMLFAESLRNRAGIERMTVELANMLSDVHNVSIVTIETFNAELCPYKVKENVKTLSLGSSFHKSMFSKGALNIVNIRKLREIVLKERPDIIITVATPLVRISAPAIRGLKIKNIAWEHFNLWAGSKIGSIYKMLAPWFVDKTVVLTEADAKDYVAMKAPRIQVIPNFTSMNTEGPSSCDNKVILAVGRHAPQKGFDMLIQAWAKTDAPGWTLRIVGSGADKQDNEKLAEDLGVANRILFKDSTPHIAEEFRQSSCFVLSSRYEGLVLVLIEAKMMGLPCISFDCPNSPREVIHDGTDGWLVENGNVDKLAETLSARLSDHEALKEAGRKARADAIERYSPEAVMSLWENLFDTI